MSTVAENAYRPFLEDSIGPALKFIGGPAGAINAAINLWQAGQLTREARLRGEGPIGAVGGAILQTAAYEFFPALMWAQAAATVVPALMQAGFARYESRKSWWDSLSQPNMGVYLDTSAALTMRQAAVQAIQQSRLNARSVLGQEARLFAGL